MRDDFSQKTKETLAKRTGMRCSNPNHRVMTSGPHDDPTKFVNIGVAAHISAAAPGGPRYVARMPKAKRSSIANGIWLCQNCAKLVDNDPEYYTTRMLRQWKRGAERAAKQAVESQNANAPCKARSSESPLQQAISYGPARDQHADFFPRDWLARDLEKHCLELKRKGVGGYWLLIADPCFGKSAFAASIFRPESTDVVGHFFKRDVPGWRDVTLGFRSVVTQLLQVHPRVRVDPGWPLTVQFAEALRQASGEIAKSGASSVQQRQVIVLDGLDEAETRPGEANWLDYLPRDLPAAIIVVLTGRPGKDRYGWLQDNPSCRLVPLDPSGRSSRDEMLHFLQARATVSPELTLQPKFIEQLADACENLFGLACWFLDPRRTTFAEDLAQWQRSPESIPRGLRGWLREQWSRLVKNAKVRGVSECVVEGIMGALAIAKEPLSEEQLNCLLAEARDGLLARPRPLESFDFEDLKGNRVGEVLQLAGEFFDPAPTFSGDRLTPCRFFHTSFPRYIVGDSDQPGVLTSRQLEDIQVILTAGCCRAWKNAANPARGFALRCLAELLRESDDAANLYKLCDDQDFLGAQRTLPDDPNLPLHTIQQTILLSFDRHDYATTARFLVAHVHEAERLRRRSPVSISRKSGLAAALRAADQNAPGIRLLHYLILFLDLHRSGKMDDANVLWRKLRALPSPRLAMWQARLAAYCMAPGLRMEPFEDASEWATTLLDDQGVESLAETFALRQEYEMAEKAMSLGRQFTNSISSLAEHLIQETSAAVPSRARAAIALINRSHESAEARVSVLQQVALALAATLDPDCVREALEFANGISHAGTQANTKAEIVQMISEKFPALALQALAQALTAEARASADDRGALRKRIGTFIGRSRFRAADDWGRVAQMVEHVSKEAATLARLCGHLARAELEPVILGTPDYSKALEAGKSTDLGAYQIVMAIAEGRVSHSANRWAMGEELASTIRDGDLRCEACTALASSAAQVNSAFSMKMFESALQTCAEARDFDALARVAARAVQVRLPDVDSLLSDSLQLVERWAWHPTAGDWQSIVVRDVAKTASPLSPEAIEVALRLAENMQSGKGKAWAFYYIGKHLAEASFGDDLEVLSQALGSGTTVTANWPPESLMRMMDEVFRGIASRPWAEAESAIEWALDCAAKVADELSRAWIHGNVAMTYADFDKTDEALGAIRNIGTHLEDNLNRLALTFAVRKNLRGIRGLLVSCAFQRVSAYQMCRRLAQINPSQKDAIESIVPKAFDNEEVKRLELAAEGLI